MPDAGKLVYDLLLLEGNLHRVGQCLPRASAAVAEMGAERGESVWGGGLHPGDITLRIAAAHLVDLHIHDIAWNPLLYEDDLAVNMRETVSFCSGRLDRDIFQKGFVFSAHNVSFGTKSGTFRANCFLMQPTVLPVDKDTQRFLYI